MEAAELAAAAHDAATQSVHEGFTAEAIRNGVFGSPTYIVDGELFWGQDRLDFVERKLRNAGRTRSSASSF